MKKPGLLLPEVKDLFKIKNSVFYRVDAVYAGIPEMSLIVKPKFTLEEMENAIPFAHNIGKN